MVDFEFGGNKILIKYNGKDENIEIPPFTSGIAWHAFEENPYVKQVKINNGNSQIGEYAFKNCGGLEAVGFPANEISIGRGAFEGSSLSSAIVKGKAKVIGDRAFADCKKLEWIVFGAGIGVPGQFLFEGCDNLKLIDVKWNMIAVNCRSFAKCAVKEVRLPHGLEIIGDYAFEDCVNLEAINIPDSVVYIGEGAFKNCRSLKKMLIPETLKDIGDGAFPKDCEVVIVPVKRSQQSR